jgi:hypothetical protein
MRQRAEDELDILQPRIFGRHEAQLAAPDARNRAPLVVCAGKRQLERWMLPNEATELPAGVPARAENSNWNLIHDECIIMHDFQVNAFTRGSGESHDPAARLNGQQA